MVYGFGLVVLSSGVLHAWPPEVEGGEERENVGLEECHQEFDHVHEDHEERAEHARADADTASELLSQNEDERGEGQDDDVSRRDVGRQTDHQNERLDEDAGDLNRDKDELDRKGTPAGQRMWLQ